MSDLIFDRDKGIHQNTLVPPSFSFNGNIGIEQDGNYLGAYTLCCLADPVYDGGWKCFGCKVRVRCCIPEHQGTTFELHGSSSEAELRDYLANWLDRSIGDITATITWS